QGYDEEEYDEETRDEESFDPILQTLENNNDEGNGDEDIRLNVGGEEEDKLYRDVNISQGFAGAVSTIPEIVQQYMDQQMNEAVKVAVQIQSDRLRDEAQRENDEFL
nr:hypothetical protein [Tanacetum cinerariifolium]